MRKRNHNFLVGTEFLLSVAGILCLTLCAAIHVESVRAARKAAPFGQRAGSSQHASPVQSHVNPTAGNGAPSAVIGKLEIRQLSLKVPIMADYESASLLKGIGHIPGTAMPGGLGTLGLAGHRDTYFRPLRGIRKDMDIEVSDQSGLYHYRVDSTEIVTPDDVRVLSIGMRPGLTLITCYPFYYVGSAPKRFIVHAHLLSVLPD